MAPSRFASGSQYPSSTVLRSGNKSYSDEEWVQAINGGDKDAFDALFQANYKELVAFARHYVRTLEVAEEIVQDIFLNIWLLGPDWQPKGSLQAYLYGATRNRSYNYLNRRRGRQQDLPLEQQQLSTVDSADRSIRDKEVRYATQQAIEALPERRRLVFKLSRNHGLTYAEIAAVLDISVNVVEKQMVKALKFLRKRLSAYLSVLL